MVGYFDTTGLPQIGWRITDEQQDPPSTSSGHVSAGSERYHTERLMRLEGTCWCYTADEYSPEVGEPPAMQNGHVTFGSLNKIIKVCEPCVRLWADVLKRIAGAKLMLVARCADAAAIVRARFERLGISSERLVIVPKAGDRWEYLRRFGEIDIALDTFPFNGITTTCDGAVDGRAGGEPVGPDIRVAGRAEYSEWDRFGEICNR